MSHPHESYLKEFEIAIQKMVPLTPEEIIEEAKKLHAELSADQNTNEKQINQAMALIGRKEFPYRKAFHELCAGDEEQRLQQLVFERIEESLAKKIKELTSHGVILEDYVKSPLFEEQLEGDDRHQIEQAILLADDILKNQCDERAHARQKTYDELVKKWTDEADRLQGLINHLRSMATVDAKWLGEINSICDRLEEGWSVVERDPEEEEIKKEIEYWTAVLHDEGEGDGE